MKKILPAFCLFAQITFAQTPTLVKDIYNGTVGSLSYYGETSRMANLNGTLIFGANDGTVGAELWKSNGTSAGTVLVKDIKPNDNQYFKGSDPTLFITIGNYVFFAAYSGLGELYRTDGTTAGTIQLSTFSGSEITNIGTTAYYANNGELWKSNGTIGGTSQVKDIVPSGDSSPRNLTNVNGTLYFVANDDADVLNEEIWKSNGTSGGTVKVKELNTNGSSSPTGLISFDNKLYFFAFNNDNGGWGLYKSDGTSAGTVLVKSGLYDPSNAIAPSDPIVFNGALYFTANTAGNGVEIWKSDGTNAGTVLLKDINVSGFQGGGTHEAAVLGSYLYFSATDGINGIELWRTDGTANGTVLFKDIRAGNGSSDPAKLKTIGTKIYFQASTAANGAELWQTDGIADNTVQLPDIASGSMASIPAYFTEVNGTIFFRATSYGFDVELWKLDINSNCPPTLAPTGNITTNQKANSSVSTTGTNIIPTSVNVTYQAGKYVQLNPGFRTQGNTVFQTKILAGCN
ncbi:ELWxxDGT repeat protein [Emticicia sp. C21]|uniref:ELWxxDGT repeat protein n=1 Tax=Emticicia sp. C21 TaxID=2302915 RepID=UPI000E3512F5|nr:ELWxxDGT repeat protein [Emticicia sp. C21]RFS17326.1 hypothetical protein D0T08_05965 [Emticicia sp. C21]